MKFYFCLLCRNQECDDLQVLCTYDDDDGVEKQGSRVSSQNCWINNKNKTVNSLSLWWFQAIVHSKTAISWNGDRLASCPLFVSFHPAPFYSIFYFLFFTTATSTHSALSCWLGLTSGRRVCRGVSNACRPTETRDAGACPGQLLVNSLSTPQFKSTQRIRGAVRWDSGAEGAEGATASMCALVSWNVFVLLLLRFDARRKGGAAALKLYIFFNSTLFPDCCPWRREGDGAW